MKVTENIIYVGVNDYEVDLFEGQYRVPEGMSYNSYVILDEKTAVVDTVDEAFGEQWILNVDKALQGRKPDYLIIQHMEPDHSANIPLFTEKYPEARIVATPQALKMMDQFFSLGADTVRIPASNGGELALGQHSLQFIFAPMVHWPEVMMTYESTQKVLFSADGFGRFGALEGESVFLQEDAGQSACGRETGQGEASDRKSSWADEARRYYIGIVGKYGMQVQNVLKKAAGLDIRMICPLHGPVLRENLGYYIGLYDTWSSYRPEEEGVAVVYASVYGHTKEAALFAAEELRAGGIKTAVYDLARDDMAAAVADAFRYSKLILASNTCNMSINPFMSDFITRLAEHSYQKRTVGLIENGSWAPAAAKVMKGMLEKCKEIDFAENIVTLMSTVKPEDRDKLKALAEEMSC